MSPVITDSTGLSLLMSTYQSGKMVTLREMDGLLNTSRPPTYRKVGWRP